MAPSDPWQALDRQRHIGMHKGNFSAAASHQVFEQTLGIH